MALKYLQIIGLSVRRRKDIILNSYVRDINKDFLKNKVQKLLKCPRIYIFCAMSNIEIRFSPTYCTGYTI